MLLLVGSRALGYLRPSLLNRQPADTDYIGRIDDIMDWARIAQPLSFLPADNGKKYIAQCETYGDFVEFEIAWPGSTGEELLELAKDVVRGIGTADHGQGVIYPTIEMLYALKMSHRYLRNSPHFLKTMNDILTMRAAGYSIPEYLQDWFKRREKETYNYSHPSLNQGKGDFFSGDGVRYVYEHDDIHLAVARIPGVPAYKEFQADGAEVAVDRNKWEALPLERKLDSVLEESYVLALERSQIPFGAGVITPWTSFQIALEKVCTSITSGWWREFAWEHYHQVIDRYRSSYVDKFWRAVENGQVGSYRGNVRN